MGSSYDGRGNSGESARRSLTLTDRGARGMDIFVCVKQVPATNKVQVDEKTGVLKRSGVMSKMNP